MQSLNLPAYPFKIKSDEDKKYIFDEIRKKYVALTPEEWVRQHFIMFMTEYKDFPRSLIGVEVPVSINNLKKRCDIVFYNSSGKSLVLVECKAPDVVLNKDVFDQIGIYDMVIASNIFIVTNGMTHYCFKATSDKKKFEFLREIPSYKDLISC